MMGSKEYISSGIPVSPGYLHGEIKLRPDEEKVKAVDGKCSRCGAEVVSPGNFCGECGAVFVKKEEASGGKRTASARDRRTGAYNFSDAVEIHDEGGGVRGSRTRPDWEVVEAGDDPAVRMDADAVKATLVGKKKKPPLK